MTNNPPPLQLPKLVTLTKPLLVDYIYICQRLPEDERRQWLAFSDEPVFDPERMALLLACRAGPKWCVVESDGTPVALGGYDQLREGVWTDFLIGTPEGWRDHWRAITKACKRVMAHMLATEAHRLQTIVLEERRMAQHWFRAVGLTFEGKLHGYGRHGENALMYARTVPVVGMTNNSADLSVMCDDTTNNSPDLNVGCAAPQGDR